MKISVLLTLSIIIILFNCGTSMAQQFKWVRGGGSTYDLSSLGSMWWERTEFMCTDINGNIYALNRVGPYSISADTFHSSAWSSPANILITSYTCNGQMRWAKLIGSSAGLCVATGIVTDGLGHIYVGGYMSPNGGTLHIGNDATFSGASYQYQTQALIQFDTSGNYQWLKFVGENSSATYTHLSYLGSALAIDAANDIHFFNYFQTGVHITSSVTSVGGTYDLAYNSSGSLIGITKLDLDSEWTLRQAVIDPASNKLYVCGEINPNLVGGSVADTFYAAAFGPLPPLVPLWRLSRQIHKRSRAECRPCTFTEQADSFAVGKHGRSL